MLTNKKWWRAALIRALKTVCQTALATIGTTALIEEVNWIAVASASALAGVLSLLTSLAGLPEVEDESGYNAVSDGWPVDDEGPAEQPEYEMELIDKDGDTLSYDIRMVEKK